MAQQDGSLDINMELPMPEGLPESTAKVPYRILLISDLAGSGDGAVSGSLESELVQVTPDTFDALMNAARPRASFTLADPTLPGSVMTEVALEFNSLKSFLPRNVAEQLPSTRLLLSLRDRIAERMHGKMSAEQLSQLVSSQAKTAGTSLNWLLEAVAWTPVPRAASPGAVDSLMGQIDLGDGDSSPPGAPPKSPLGSLISAAAGGGAALPAEEASAMRRALAEIDRRLNSWLNTVLHAPQVQAIESAWRSLAFLVSHMDFRRGLALQVLHSSKANLADRLTSLLIDPVFDQGADAPDLIVADMAFGNSAPDMETLDLLAQNAASLPAVALAGASPEFLGVKQAWQVPTLPNLLATFDQWQFAKWKTLRGQAYARMLGVVFGRCLLRTAHSREEAKNLEFFFNEECLTDKDLVWANGPIALACAAAGSVVETGWPTCISGFISGRIEGFATAQGGKKGEKKFGPTDTLMPQPKIEELAAGGLNAVVGVRDHDDAIVWNGLTAARPPRFDTGGLLEVSLPYQLFAARLSGLLLALRARLKGLASDKVVEIVTAHVCEWLGVQGTPSPEQLKVQVGTVEGKPGVPHLAVTVAPPPRILAGGIPMVLGYPLN